MNAIRRPLPTTHKFRQFRSMLLESLELRQLFAADFGVDTTNTNQVLKTSITKSQQAAYGPFQLPKFDLQNALGQTESKATLNPQLEQMVNNGVALGQWTYAPEKTIQAFQSTTPTLGAAQSILVGSVLGSQVRWNDISTSKSAGSFQFNSASDKSQIDRIVDGGFVSALVPTKSVALVKPKIATSLTGEQYQSLVASRYFAGSHCNEDGSLAVFENAGEGEPPNEGSSGGSSGSLIPQVEFPTINSRGSPESFAPNSGPGTVSSLTLHGSFTNSSLTNPDLTATGLNWAHSVTSTWTSEFVWSYTERLVLSYNLSSSENNSSANASNASADSAQPPDPNLTSSWTATASANRGGYFIYTFTASRGITSASAAGVAWSVAVSYSDVIHFEASASGGSTYIRTTGSTTGSGGCGTACQDNEGTSSGAGETGSGNSSIQPDNFQAASNWAIHAGFDVHSNGTFTASSTPSLAPTGGIDRAVSTVLTYDQGGTITGGSSWSSSTRSGTLVPDNDPTWCVVCSSTSGNPASSPIDPNGPVRGSGHGSSSGGDSSSQQGGNVTGGLNIQGTKNGSKWKGLIGNAIANFQADAHGDGHSKHGFVLQDDPPTATPIEDGLRTTKVLISYGWDSGGNDTTTEDANGNTIFSATPEGGVATDDSGNSAHIGGGGNGDGTDFLNVNASIKDRIVWNKHDAVTPSGVHLNLVGYRNTGDYLTYRSKNVGKDIESLTSSINGNSEPSAAATSTMDVKGKEYLKLAADSEHNFVQSYWVPGGPGVTSSDSVGSYNEYTELSNEDLAGGTVTATWIAADTVAKSGSATKSHESKVKYDFHSDGTDHINRAGGLNVVSNRLRNANFERSKTYGATYDATTDTYTESNPIVGTTLVSVSGFENSNDADEIDFSFGDHQLTGKTEYELALEGIFVNSNQVPGEGEVEDPPLPPGDIPSNPNAGADTFLSWFGGARGDAYDQVNNFASGLGDNTSMGLSWVIRDKVFGFNTVDYDSSAYVWGDRTGTAIGVATGGAAMSKGLYKLATAVDDIGRCANPLAKFVMGGCFVAGTLVTLSDMPRSQAVDDDLWSSDSLWRGMSESDYALDSHSSTQSKTATISTLLKSPGRTLVPIEQVPLGARVPTRNPKPWEYDDSLPQPDQETWVKISITVDRTDGGIVDAELLRPGSWAKSHGLEVGTLMPLNIAELQVSGVATINAIERCPTISKGEGSVITARFLTRNVDVIARAEILGADGSIEVLEGTTIHPIWSLDRNDWVPLGELKRNEQLAGEFVEATVLNLTILSRPAAVYNVEVHGEHVYQVGEVALLVHNAAGCIDTYKELRAITKGSGLHSHHLIEKRFAGILKQKAGDMMSMIVNPTQHQQFTNAWRAAIPYGFGTASANRATIEAAARRIYANYPSILDALGL